ncbi:hypothetical protein TanjilG_28643 [Lupinus angustifolius]|uniref:Secreted protein n=1 Tax=Lupinus angustifolius TaxID=3871 RepID=A0A4P1RPT3_LUPAN|nr:hypothetical protein TanjilG_28643 [Lupinus angustifolius]
MMDLWQRLGPLVILPLVMLGSVDKSRVAYGTNTADSSRLHQEACFGGAVKGCMAASDADHYLQEMGSQQDKSDRLAGVCP